VIEGDLLQVDLSSADVVTLYLLTKSNDLLRPQLEKTLKPGARVVSHDYARTSANTNFSSTKFRFKSSSLSQPVISVAVR
jgi:hypothetical protein